ncbi:hypothetical protein IV203_010878 [Nitzschia inconspicua]|uniref:SET domain-containing protein n=1 Tax=Nitzschia inconspicua TaxID=303405 RepID=A0A9K3KX94_9STRA|nr:hypothetical protein IV203_010878 [Nitzschia inconspicua]
MLTAATALAVQEKLPKADDDNGSPIENKMKWQYLWICSEVASYRFFLLNILFGSILCFWMGRIVVSETSASFSIPSSNVQSSFSDPQQQPPQIVVSVGTSQAVSWNSSPFPPESQSNLQRQPQAGGPSLNRWISNVIVVGEEGRDQEASRLDDESDSTSTAATTTTADCLRLPLPQNLFVPETSFQLLDQKEQGLAASRIQYFQELVVHPVLMTMKEDHQAERIAIVLDDGITKKELLTGLVQQILNYPSIRHILVVDDSPKDCKDTWIDLSQLVVSTSVAMECVSKESLSSSLSFQVDVVFLLDDCNVFDRDDDDDDDDDAQAGGREDDLEESMRLWFQHLSPESGSLVTCLGETLPLHHPRASLHHKERLEKIDALEDADFQRIVEYDIRLAQSRYAQSIVVAWKNETSLAQWRMNEAHYVLRMHSRLVDPSSLSWFDSATMVSLKYPSKHSALRFCQWTGNLDLDDDLSEHLCTEEGHGYDPYIRNIPVDDLYVGKSQAGDHAGRGVFTKVDIPTSSYLALETTVHSIIYEWPTTELYNDMQDSIPDVANTKGNIIFVFAEAYGYAQEPWNMAQDTVMSHLLNFVNHGCNGTANTGDFTNVTEFTVDLDLGEIPDVLQTKVDIPYAPHFDRDHVKFDTMTRTFRPIAAGEEIYDNYMSFGGESHFQEMVETLRQECSGSFGMVEKYQMGRKVGSEIHTANASLSNMFRGGTDEL